MPRLVRAVVIALLLYTGADLLGCDLLLQPACELGGAPAEDDSNRRSSGSDCFCCCFHVVLPPSFELKRDEPVTPAVVLPIPSLPASDPLLIFHPPEF